jgi:hypothetical protein
MTSVFAASVDVPGEEVDATGALISAMAKMSSIRLTPVNPTAAFAEFCEVVTRLLLE